MQEVRIQTSSEPEATGRIVSAGLRGFNRTFLGEYGSEPIAVDVYGEDGTLVGGAVGSIHLGWLFVDMLWIPDSLRSLGIGSSAMNALELEAIRRGADRAILDTMGFQAERFYANRGYVECGRIANFASGFDRIFMIKRLR